MLTYEEFISTRIKHQWTRTIEDFDDFFDQAPNNEVSIDELVTFLRLTQEKHKDKTIRIQQNNSYTYTSTYFTYIEYETDEDYHKRMQKAYDVYLKKFQSSQQSLEDKIKTLESEIVELKSRVLSG